MTIQFDAASSANTLGAALATLTWAHTVTAAGTGRLLTVGVSIKTTAGQIVTGITYAGVALTKLDDHDSPIPDVRAELWYLKSPSTGANNIVVTLSAGARFCAGGMSFTEVDQVDTFGTVAEANGFSMLATVNVVSSTEQVVIDVCAKHNTRDYPIVVGANQTQRYQTANTHGVDTGNAIIAGSTEPGAGAVVMSWSWALFNQDWAIIAVPIKPASPLRSRLTKYHTNSNDPKKRILDVIGRNVPPEQTEVGAWMRSEGPYSITPKKHASLIEEPSIAFIESLHYGARGDRLSMESVTETQLESLFSRLGGNV